jgi:AraC-like DNA-binding protein
MPIGISEDQFIHCRDIYEQHWPGSICACDTNGKIVLGEPQLKKLSPETPNFSSTAFPSTNSGENRARSLAIRDGHDFGESTLSFCGDDHLIWAVPLMQNSQLTGGLVAHVLEEDFYHPETNTPKFDFRLARDQLREMLEGLNLTNGAALLLHRQFHAVESKKAESIRIYKQQINRGNIRQLYLGEEPALFAAIRSRDFGQARQILNRILLVIHNTANEDFELVRCFLLELVVSINRTAIEGGADPSQLLGKNYGAMVEISTVSDQESLTEWLVSTLENMFAVISKTKVSSASLIREVLNYMNEHLDHPLTRDDMALRAKLSPNHFSNVIKKETGFSFSDLLNRMRIDTAAEQLTQNEISLAQVALKVGFSDQSYFTKVFKKMRGVTPLSFRKKAMTHQYTET